MSDSGNTPIPLVTEQSNNQNLRTRIAAVIYHAASQWDAHPWDALAEHVQAAFRAQADAVLEELKLRRETVGLIHRYVTNWQGSDNE